MEAALGMVIFFVLTFFVFLIGGLFALTVYPEVAFLASLLIFSLFAWSYSSNQDKKKWIRRNFGLFAAFCGFFCLVLFCLFLFLSRAVQKN